MEKEWRSSTSRDCIRSCSDLGVAANIVEVLVVHKSANLLEHCPVHARRQLKRDYNRIIYAKDGIVARRAYAEFVSKWTALAPAVVRSLEEAGEHLLTFYEFPRALWKSIRTTNAVENLNREFRRRTKTQASFTTEESAVALLFGLVGLRPDQATTHRRQRSAEDGIRAISREPWSGPCGRR